MYVERRCRTLDEWNLSMEKNSKASEVTILRT
jgi:hypothetical protein